MKKYSKIFSLTILLIFACMMFTSIFVLADIDIDGIKSGITDGINENVDGEEEIADVGGIILTGIKYIGFALGIILVVWFGIKWMIAGAQQRAQLKEQAWNYVIGIGLLFGAGPLAQWIYNIVNNIND